MLPLKREIENPVLFDIKCFTGSLTRFYFQNAVCGRYFKTSAQFKNYTLLEIHITQLNLLCLKKSLSTNFFALDIKCYNWSNSLESSLLVNPMQEFTAFNAEKAIDFEKRYVEYKKNHAKEDVDQENEVQKMQIFKDNAR